MYSNSVPTLANGMVAITPILPTGSGVGEPFKMAAAGPHLSLGNTASSSPMMERFRKGEPMALGTVQIMVGILVFLFGIVIAASIQSLSVLSGIFVWGAFFYIIAGSLTVAAGRTLNKCLVKGSLGMNIVAAIVSLTGVIIYSLDAAGVTFYCYYYPSYPSYPSFSNHHFGDDHDKIQYSSYSYSDCRKFFSQTQGVSGVLALFSLLEFMVSISVSVFACKATCCSEPEQVFIVGNQFTHGNTEIPVISNPPFNLYETVTYPKALENDSDLTACYMNDPPPQYTPAL